MGGARDSLLRSGIYLLMHQPMGSGIKSYLEADRPLIFRPS